MGLLRVFLSPNLNRWIDVRYTHARHARGMGMLTARLQILVLLFAHVVFRLEGPAWQGLLVQYCPWFTHLNNRRYRVADPLRYALQATFLTVLQIPTVISPRRWEIRINRFINRLSDARNAFHQRLPGIAVPRLSATVGVQRLFRLHETSWFNFSASTSWQFLVWSLGAVVSMTAVFMLMSQPFNLWAQLVFVLMLWAAALLIRRVPGRFSSLLLIVLSLTVSARYIWWRYTATLNWDSGKDVFFGLFLLGAETYSWLVLILGYVQTIWPLKRPVAPLPTDTSLWPLVDLMIPTYNEDLSVVKPTVYAALGIDWPKDRIRIHLLDDGRREHFREFAKEAGINYIIRPDGRHAKAGNLNHAMSKTDADLIAIFDCDHIPSRSFLQLTVGWFLKDPKLALVQTPHHFFSPDPFERNLGHFGINPNENTLFYGLVQDGNDLWNSAFFCGSCAILRRSALDDIGGFAVETVTEDAHTALRLHRKGYNSAYIRIPMAAGLATESLSAHIGQRIRWARGMVQIFRTDNPLFGKGLTLFQRLCYANAMLHFLAGVPRLIYLLAPLAFLLFHSYIIYAPAVLILLYVLPHMIHASLTNSVTQGPYRRTFWGEIYETVLAWYIAWPTTVALFAPKKGSFNVTAKGGLIKETYFDWKISLPYVLLTMLNMLGFAVGLWRLYAGPADEIWTVIVTMLWVVYNLVILGGAIAVAAEGKQIRESHRVAAALPASVCTKDNRVLAATLSDFSETGVGLTLKSTTSFDFGDHVLVYLTRGQLDFGFRGTVAHQLGNQLGVRLEELDRQAQIDFVQCTFARADAWVTAGSNFPDDRPTTSFAEIVRVSVRGYRRMAMHMPFPLKVYFNVVTRSLLWLGSFVPRRHPVEYYDYEN